MMTQYYQLFNVQANKEIDAINTLLQVSKQHQIPDRSTKRQRKSSQQPANLLLKETPKFKSWKICEDDRPHQIDYIADDKFNLQRQLYRSGRSNTGLSLADFSKRPPKRCGFDETDIDNPCKKTGASMAKAQSPKGKDQYYEFKHCANIDGHIKRYRKEVTHKIIADYLSVILLENKSSMSLGKHGLYCCPHLLSLFKAKTRHQKPISKASFICYNLNFDEQNGMQSEFGCLRVGPVDSSCSCGEKTRQTSKKHNTCSIPNITLPSMKEITDCATNKKCFSGPGGLSNSASSTKQSNSHPNSAEKPTRRSTTVLNYLRPKIPQAAMPKKEKNFYACIMPVRTKHPR